MGVSLETLASMFLKLHDLYGEIKTEINKEKNAAKRKKLWAKCERVKKSRDPGDLGAVRDQLYKL